MSKLRWGRLRLKWQLMLPFGLLAVLWATTGSFLLTRTATSRAESRIGAELYERIVTSGSRFTDVVAAEVELERLAAYTAGVPEAVNARNGARLGEVLSPLLVNSRADVLIVLDADGNELISLWRRNNAVEALPAALSPEVRDTIRSETSLAMNKSVLVAQSAQGDLLLTAGGVPGPEPRGRIAVGLQASTVAARLSPTGGVALYEPTGRLVGASGVESALTAEQVVGTELARTEIDGQEALVGSLSGRGRTLLRLAVFTDSRTILDEVRATALALLLVGSFATLGVLVLGWYLARTITRRLERVADAARRITKGDLSPRAAVTGSDEIGLLAMTFNTMTEELQTRSRTLAERERHFRSIVQNSTDVIMIVNRFGKFTYQSPSIETIFGHAPDAHYGGHLSMIVHSEDLGRLSSMIGELADEPSGHRSVDARLRHANGTWRSTEIVLTNLLDEPAVAGIVLNTRDVTDRLHLEHQLRHQAYHDALTGLANRVLFSARVREVLAERDHRRLAVLFLDLDDFKTVNDSLGHAAGDALLQAVARRLESCLSPNDIVARLGGDEFALLLQEGATALDPFVVAKRILEALEAPVVIDGREIVVAASIGVADDPAHTLTVDEILQHADLALAEAKRKGRNRFEPYHPEMGQQADARLELGVQLRRAIDREELAVHYQPIFELATGHLTGFEALSRWTIPGVGPVSPEIFIPLAEETGLIHILGRRVLLEACARLRRWQLATGDEELSMSVNLSVRQLQEPDLVDHVMAALAATGIAPRTLTLEITESVLMHDADVAASQMEALRNLGVRLAIDDFGTGYSSLSYIERFPVDVLKIDKSFIVGVEDGSRRSALLRAIAGLGSAIGLKTVVEGIETGDQLEMLRAFGFDRAQGYYLGRPGPREEIEALLSIEPEVEEPIVGRVRISADRSV
jgi:diguanylate cyclase (GGDEF)-like protein/PAS domain S-box-containing protein